MDLEKILSKLPEDEQKYLSSLIDKDPLTGVYNRRKFDRDIELVVSMADRTRRGTSLLMLDIDHFKQYNDRYGHRKGDLILKVVSKCIENNLRDYDKIHIYRYGGEEFVVMISDISTDHACQIGERLRDNVKETCGVTVSIGISHYKESSDTLQSLIENADMAMYAAKQKGRDRVVVFDEVLSGSHAEH